MEYIRTLKQRQLVTLWISQILSCIGDQLYTIAIVWIAVQTGGASAGFVAASGSLAGMCLGLVGGVYADRWDRQKTMIAVDLLRALAVLALVATAQCMPLTMWQMALTSIVVSSLSSLFDPALQASLPELAKTPGSLQAMNALMMVNHRFARTVGPGFAGLLVALMPIHHFFTLDAITFVISAAAIFSIGRHYRWKTAPSKSHIAGLPGLAKDIATGAKLVWEHEQLLWTFGIYIASNVAWAASYIIGFPLWAKQVLGGNVGTFGTLVAAYGFGSVLANIAMGTFMSRRRMFFISISEIVFAIGFLIFAFANTLPVACFGVALAATGGPMGDIMLVTMMQTDMPREHLGKVYSLRYFIMNMGLAAGLLIAPWLFTVVNACTGIALCCVIFAVIGTAGLLKFGLKKSVISKINDTESGARLNSSDTSEELTSVN